MAVSWELSIPKGKMLGQIEATIDADLIRYLTFSPTNLILVDIRAGYFMSIDRQGIRKIGIWLLLLAFVFAAIALPLLSVDSPDAATAVTFTLILIVGILFALSLNPQQLVCSEYQFGIRPRSPPNR